ncbi:hypothetical protein Clacol_002852 [Clathrus columnatus]|uniref:TFIIS N-terminal domain-containing protein n=1 Tax=Clathrus columnatus TaxID=1419009 RepID=A0AAV5A5Z0_9AGAM|nr:hypothetical protein Clacol_002852 [Clathrus columnatus]
MTSQSKNIEREIFGGSDSELSDFEEPPRRPQQDEDSGGDSVEDSRLERFDRPRKKRREDADRISRKRKRKVRTEKEIEEMDPETARKAQMDLKIESILKTKKGIRPKKRKKDAEEDVLDRFADEEVSRLKETMIIAAEEDIAANREHLPATSKLKMLPQVMETLQKNGYAQSIVDNNLLEGVRRWLEPLPDKSLPALNIQSAFFDILGKMYIDTNTLKDSQLGRIVLFYTKCKRVTSAIQRQAVALVSRDRHIPLAPEDSEAPSRQTERLNAILARARQENERNRVRKNAVSIPQAVLDTYTVAPRPLAGVKSNPSVDQDVARRKHNAERLRALTRRIAQNQKGGR